MKNTRRKPLPWEEQLEGRPAAACPTLGAFRRWAVSGEPGPHATELKAGSVNVYLTVTHTSNAPVDDLSPAELAGACPAPIRCLALASPSPVSFSSVCPHPEVRTPGLRSARGTRQLYRAGS